jgi:hypothetical protein
VILAEPDPKVADEIILITADNFVRAETHLYFGNAVSAGRFDHCAVLAAATERSRIACRS